MEPPIPMGPPHSQRSSRPGALHLNLPLADQHFLLTSHRNHPKDKLFLFIPPTRLSMASGPKSSASIYSQGSWNNSPVSPAFPSPEARVDRRRFAIAISPSQDGPWKDSFPSADTPVFMIEPQDTPAESDMPLTPKDAQDEGRKADGKEKQKKSRSLWLKKVPTTPSTAPRSTTMSTSMLGKIFSRRLAHPRQSTSTELEPIIIIGVEQPSLPTPPPQVLISLPSPELNIIDGLEQFGGGGSEDGVTGEPKLIRSLPMESESVAPQPGLSLPIMPVHLSPSVPELEKSTPIQPQPTHNLRAWRPKRPPSPVTPGMRRNSKLKGPRRAPMSPLPPVPALVRHNTLAVARTLHAPFSIPSSPPPPYQFHSLLGHVENGVPDDEMTLEMRLKARALKSVTYTLHEHGIFSPTLSIC